MHSLLVPVFTVCMYLCVCVCISVCLCVLMGEVVER